MRSNPPPQAPEEILCNRKKQITSFEDHQPTCDNCEGSGVQWLGIFLVFPGHLRQVLTLALQLAEDGAALQHVVDVLDHDPLHVLQLRVEIVEVPPPPGVAVGLLGLLDVGVELYEAVGSGGRVDLVPVLAVELGGKVVQEAVGNLLTELSLCQGQETCLLLYDVAAN